jgi:hypothetical protein
MVHRRTRDRPSPRAMDRVSHGRGFPPQTLSAKEKRGLLPPALPLLPSPRCSPR